MRIIDVEYSIADFERVFHVTPLLEVEETPEATKLLDQNNVWKEMVSIDHSKAIAQFAGKVTEWFENLGNQNMNRLYV